MKNRKIYFLSLCFLSLFFVGKAWSQPEENPSLNAVLKNQEVKGPFDGLFTSVRTKILQSLEKTRVASISVAIAKDGKIIWEEAFGWANRERKVKANPNTMYSLASISKPITATGLMILVERGLVDLNKPANTYLGEGKLTAYEGKAEDATVKRILHHTAGLPMHWNFIYENEPYDRPSMDETIQHYGILVTAPGEMFHYANLGYGIIDHIISRVSGKSYTDFMRTEVFEPLGMARTTVNIDPNLKENIALRYDERQKPIPFYDFDHRGASAVFSSAHDLVRFGMFHLKSHLKDQKPILKDETIDAMQQEVDSKVPDSGYMLGWGVGEKHAYKFVNHSGGMPGVATRLILIPSEDIVSVVLCNGENSELGEIEKAIFAALLPDIADKTKAEKKKPEEEKIEKFSPPESLIGEWTGEIKTYTGILPVKLIFKKDGKVRIELEGKTYSPLNIKTPLGFIKFKKGIFSGPFFGNIKTEDTARSPHVIQLHMKLRGQRMSGYAAAVAIDKKFCFPSYIELKRSLTQKEN